MFGRKERVVLRTYVVTLIDRRSQNWSWFHNQPLFCDLAGGLVVRRKYYWSRRTRRAVVGQLYIVCRRHAAQK